MVRLARLMFISHFLRRRRGARWDSALPAAVFDARPVRPSLRTLDAARPARLLVFLPFAIRNLLGSLLRRLATAVPYRALSWLATHAAATPGGTPVADLARTIRKARQDRGWSLREVERRSGISNAHLVQIEKGSISKPSPSLLWDLAELYELDYQHLMHLAGHTTDEPSVRSRQLRGAALHAVEDLTDQELVEALNWLEKLRHRRHDDMETS